MDSLFTVQSQDTPWPDDVEVVADTPHFRYIMAQSARHEAIKLLERATKQAELGANIDAETIANVAQVWINLANATEMNLDPVDYQHRSEPQDRINTNSIGVVN